MSAALGTEAPCRRTEGALVGKARSRCLPYDSSGASVHSMRVAFGTDEQTPLGETVAARLAESGHTVQVLADPAPWPEVGRLVGEAVAAGRADRGVVCCWTGTGVSIAREQS